MSNNQARAVERLAAELASWSGAESDEGWINGQSPRGNEPVPDRYQSYEEGCAAHGVEPLPRVAGEQAAIRAAWIARAQKVMRDLGLVAVPDEIAAEMRAVDGDRCGCTEGNEDREGEYCYRCCVHDRVWESIVPQLGPKP